MRDIPFLITSFGVDSFFIDSSQIIALYKTSMAHYLKNDGLHIHRTKGSRDELTLWTPRLKKIVNKAMRYNRMCFSTYLVHDKDGKSIHYEAFSTAWQRLMKKALHHGLIERFTFHDIKAKGVSDHEKKHSGHKSAAMKHVYDRKLDEVKGTR